MHQDFRSNLTGWPGSGVMLLTSQCWLFVWGLSFTPQGPPHTAAGVSSRQGSSLLPEWTVQETKVQAAMSFLTDGLRSHTLYSSNGAYTSQLCSGWERTARHWAGARPGGWLPHLGSTNAVELYGRRFFFIWGWLLSFHRSVQKRSGGKRLMN